MQFLKGVGEGRARVLHDAGLETVRDLLWFFPIRYEDRRHPARIADLGRNLDVPLLLRGVSSPRTRVVSPVKRLKLFEAILDDGTGSVKLIWFNQPISPTRSSRATGSPSMAFLARRARDRSPSKVRIGKSSKGVRTRKGDRADLLQGRQHPSQGAGARSSIWPSRPCCCSKIRSCRAAPVSPGHRSRHCAGLSHRPAELTEAILRQRSEPHLASSCRSSSPSSSRCACAAPAKRRRRNRAPWSSMRACAKRSSGSCRSASPVHRNVCSRDCGRSARRSSDVPSSAG